MNNIFIINENHIEKIDQNDNYLKNNKIYIDFCGDNAEIFLDKRIRISNENQNIFFDKNKSTMQGLYIFCGNFSKVLIENISIMNRLYIDSMATNSKVFIGEGTSIVDATIEMHDEENLYVSIGRNCLLSYKILIRPSDGHTIYNTSNKNISINYPKQGIEIQDHVWIGGFVHILKDTCIPSNCMIGMNSIVTNKKYEQKSIIAGIPAKIIKRNIGWDARNYNYFKNIESDNGKNSKLSNKNINKNQQICDKINLIEKKLIGLNDKKIQLLNNIIVSMENDLNQANEKIEQLNNTVLSRENDLNQANEKIEQLNNTVLSRENDLNQANEKIEQLNNTFLSRENDLNQANEKIEQLNIDIKNKDTILLKCNTTIESLNKQIKNLQIAVDNEKKRRLRIKNSVAWKITSPLRYMLRLVSTKNNNF